MKPLGMAVIGAGVAGRLRAAAGARHPAVSLVAVADVDEAKARAGVSGTRALPVADYGRVLEMPDVDAVIISTPGHSHESIAIEAFAARKHVLCEKPLAIDVPSCRRIIAAAAAAGRTLAVGFNHRYYPCVTLLKEVLEAGRIGTIDHVRALAGHQGLGQFRAEWMYQRAMSGGGAMMDVGIHMTDLVRFVVGDLTEVTGVCTNGVWNVPGSEDDALVIMKTADGIPVRYQATWSEWKGYRLALEVYGDRGMVGAYYAPMTNLIVSTDQARASRTRQLRLYPWINLREKLRGWQTTAENAFLDELTDFLRLIGGQATRIADGRDGLRAVAVAHAAYESSATGLTVRVPD